MRRRATATLLGTLTLLAAALAGLPALPALGLAGLRGLPAAQAETVSLPSGAATGISQQDLIYQVACPAAGDCVGVGVYKDSDGNNQALIDAESGGVWSSSAIPDSSLPNAASTTPPPVPYLTTVACAAAGDCVAADAYDDANDHEQGLIDAEVGGVWTPIAAPLSGLGSVYTNPGVEVNLVACPAAGACIGVGNYGDGNDNLEGLIETQSQTGWSASQAPWPPDTDEPSFAPDFYDLSCASAGNCAAVGYYSDASGNQQGLLESDSGGSWSATELDLSDLGPAGESPAADPQASVDAVSCPAAGSCTAVGTYEDAANAIVPFQVSELDGQWQAATALSLPGDASSSPYGAGDPIQYDLFVNDVSCASAGNCTAVGSYDATSSNDVEAFTVTETAGAWGQGTTTSLPSDSGSGSGGGGEAPADDPEAALYSVTCQSAGDCLAAGSYAGAAGGSVALLARQSAGSWSTAGANLSTPYDASLPSEYWASVACAPGGYCATGGYVANNESGLENAFMLDAPAAPSAPEATIGADGSQASVSWAAPADTGGLPLTGYTVTADDLSDPAAGGQSVTASAAATSATLGGLTATDSYSFTVSAQSLLGTGLPATSAATSAASGGPGPGPGPGPGTGTAPHAGVAPSRAQIRASLKALLERRRLAGELRTLRRARRYSFRYQALERGRLSVRWYYEETLRHDRRRKIVIASGTATAKRAAQALELGVRVTGPGRRLARRGALGRRARLTVWVSFAAVGAVAVTKSAPA